MYVRYYVKHLRLRHLRQYIIKNSMLTKCFGEIFVEIISCKKEKAKALLEQ